MNESDQVILSHCPSRQLSVLCWFLLLYEHVEGNVYGFRVKGVEVTNGAEVTKMAKEAEVSEMTEMTTGHVIIGPVADMSKGIWMTARHVTYSLGKVAV
jgi:hypothetical protein